jgi:template-activating factor I
VHEQDLKSGYSIHLTFSPNAFFANKRLSKTLSYADDGEFSMHATPVDWIEPQAGEDGAEASGSAASRKRPRGAATPPAMEASIFLRAFLWVDGEDPSCLLPGDDAADSDRPAGLAEAEAFCEAIKEDVWSNPTQFFERFTFHGEEEGEGEGEEEEEDERRQRKRVETELL